MNRLYDLNVDDDLQPVRDQLSALFGPEWFFNSASGINDLGQVVGRVENVVTGVKKGFALDTFGLSTPNSWVLLPLPEIDSDDAYGKRISLNGDVLGVYRRADNSGDCFLCNPWTPNPPMLFGIYLFQFNVDMNNFGQVAGVLSNGTPFFDGDPIPGLPTLQTFSSLSDCRQLGGVNDFGVFSVNGREKTGTKPSSKWGPLATFRVANQQERIFEGGYPEGINSAGDVAIYNDGPSYLAYNGYATVQKQVLKVTDLVPDSDRLKQLLVNNPFRVQAINDRDATGFGQLTGRVHIDGGTIGVVLTPYTP